MAKARTIKTLDDLPPGDEVVHQNEPQDDPDQNNGHLGMSFADPEGDQINKILEGAELDGGKVMILRKRRTDVEHQYVGMMGLPKSFNAEQMLEHLRLTYGGGNYKLKFNRSNGQFFKQASLTINMDELSETEKQELKNKTPVIVSQTQAAPTDPIALFKAFSEITSPNKGGGESQMMPLIVTMMMEQQKSSTTMMTALLTAMMQGNNRKGGDSINERILEIVLTKNGNGDDSFMKTLEHVKMIKELVGNGGDEEKGDDMFDKIAKLAGPVLGAFTGGRVQVQPQPPLPPGPMQNESQPQNVAPPIPPMLVGKMIQAAQRNVDPADWVDLALNMLDEGDLENLRLLLVNEDWAERLFSHPAYQPMAQAFLPVKPWFDSFRKELLAELTPDPVQPTVVQ